MHRKALLQAAAIGTVLQLAMVLVGHQSLAVAEWFGPLGMGISLVAGVLYAVMAAGEAKWVGGSVAGGVCALIGIAVSYVLGDVTALILLFGTLSSAVSGAIGGGLGGLLVRERPGVAAG